MKHIIDKINCFRVCGMLLMCTVLLGLAGCTAPARVEQFQDDNKLHIVTSIYPMQDFVEQIVADQAEVINLVPAGMEPHDFELSVAQMQLLEDADIFVYNGAGMEPFVDKTLEAVSNKKLIVVEASKDVDLMISNHTHEDDEDEHEENHFDPHTWLGIENAKQELLAIKEAICLFDEENKELYTQNADNYLEKLDALKLKFETELKDVTDNKIVVAHEAFGYMCQENGLEQEAIEGLMADSEPDAARMKEIVDFCKENDIKVIFFEELVSPKVANAIATEIGATTDVLNPIEGRTAEQEAEGKTYIELMEENLIALKKALK